MRRITLLSALAAVAGVFAVAAPGAGARTAWLCRPGHSPDPCTPSLSTTVYTPKLRKLAVQHPRRVKRPAIDCFYVYPTVSGQPTGNSNLVIGPAERSIALYRRPTRRSGWPTCARRSRRTCGGTTTGAGSC